MYTNNTPGAVEQYRGEYVYERACAHIRQQTTDTSHHYSQCTHLTDSENSQAENTTRSMLREYKDSHDVQTFIVAIHPHKISTLVAGIRVD